MPLLAQPPERPTSSELHAAIEKLGVLGSALYVAAHPDDENTRMIAYLANVAKVETAYLSLTRGDGGQNLIAPDIGPLLGLTRTQELLAARRIDGGEQFFSRANDFGYSKHPDETFNIWDRDQVIADAVWVIRTQRPDVMILRFDPRGAGTTHGHHTASAIIGVEAFDLAADPTAFPEQLTGGVEPWQPRRLYWNAYSWGSDTLPDHVDMNDVITVEINDYLPKLGESVAEIAARSRSQHKSQGFGSAGSRRPTIEKLELLKGESNGENGDPFAGLPTDWRQLPGGVAIAETIDGILASYDFDDPASSVPALIELRKQIEDLDDSRYKRDKLAELNGIVNGALGLYLSATTETAYAVPGDTIRMIIEVTNRSEDTLRLNQLMVGDEVLDGGSVLPPGVPRYDTLHHLATNDEPYSNPYWLNEEWSLGMYKVPEQSLRGNAESEPYLVAEGTIRGDWGRTPFAVPVRYRYTDPVDGEQFQPFHLLPPAFVELTEASYLFTDEMPRSVIVKVTAATPAGEGKLSLSVPEGWAVTPEEQSVALKGRGQEYFYTFELSPPAGQTRARILPELRLDGDTTVYDRRLVTIEHGHIPTQRVLLPGGASVARVDLRTAGSTVGYLPGAGDAIPEALTSIGLEVQLLDDAEASVGDLSRYDAIIVGIRAYNTLDRMPVYQPRLMRYVEQGGTLIVQYNTNRRLKIDQEKLGPYPFKLSRDRVTVEDAPVELLSPEHPALNYPNKITAADFEGWVQERGLYFPSEWDEQYTPLLSSNDPGEEAHKGGLLVADYGKGHFVYTGYSFFRELPAGVPGAYRLFANLIALGQSK